ncbi:MAG: acyltransferase [Lachnospiraceae bacterium]|nr:acyltransferase [Lachnospiraceae bacterium]
MPAERNIKLDILRILAALGVVALHVSSEYIDILPVAGVGFNIAVFINSLTRFAVPVFVMISGELFLDTQKEITVKKIWLHNVLRLFVIYLIWSYGYYVFQSLYIWKFDFYRHGLVRTVTGIVYATNHLWFIWMIIGLYILTPVIKTWLKSADEKNIRYFIDVFFFFQIIRMTLTLLVNKSLTDKMSELVTITEVSGYIGYYVLGYYLANYKINRNLKTVLYVMLPVGIALNFICAAILSKADGAYNPGIYDSFGVFTFLNCVALYLIVDKMAGKIKKGKTFIINLSKDTLGVYLVHIMLLEVVKRQFGLDFIGNSTVSIIVITIVLFVLASGIAALFRRIPKAGRFLA